MYLLQPFFKRFNIKFNIKAMNQLFSAA